MSISWLEQPAAVLPSLLTPRSQGPTLFAIQDWLFTMPDLYTRAGRDPADFGCPSSIIEVLLSDKDLAKQERKVELPGLNIEVLCAKCNCGALPVFTVGAKLMPICVQRANKLCNLCGRYPSTSGSRCSTPRITVLSAARLRARIFHMLHRPQECHDRFRMSSLPMDGFCVWAKQAQKARTA